MFVGNKAVKSQFDYADKDVDVVSASQDEYYGKTHDYSKKTDLVFSKIFLPEHIPKEFSNREYLWNEVVNFYFSRYLI